MDICLRRMQEYACRGDEILHFVLLIMRDRNFCIYRMDGGLLLVCRINSLCFPDDALSAGSGNDFAGEKCQRKLCGRAVNVFGVGRSASNSGSGMLCFAWDLCN